MKLPLATPMTSFGYVTAQSQPCSFPFCTRIFCWAYCSIKEHKLAHVSQYSHTEDGCLEVWSVFRTTYVEIWGPIGVGQPGICFFHWLLRDSKVQSILL